MSVLGSTIDLVAGGADLAFPHHAYQAALVEAASGARPFARARLAVGTVGIGGVKMAKSTGNLVLVSDLLKEHSPAAIRLLLLDRDWREAWDYQPDDLRAAATRLERLYSAGGRNTEPAGAADAVRSALLRELDAPAALDIAEEAGGDAARLVLQTLKLA
jgi:cysteinyl-tRNA synthetase